MLENFFYRTAFFHFFFLFSFLLFPALDIAIAIDCFSGLPARLSVRMFSPIIFLDDPDFSDIYF